MKDLIVLVPLLPLTGAAILGAFGGRWLREKSHLVACLTVGLAFVCALLAVVDLVGMEEGHRFHEVTLYHWLSVGGISIDIAFQLDPLSACMILMVTFVAFLIHVYSIGYMHGDPGYFRFFCYMNLFTFFMLTLVLAANFLTMFVGWEGVGLCSYLLIGFWYQKPSAAAAGMKAFITTRIGDLGLLLGMIAIVWIFGTLDFSSIRDTLVDGGKVNLLFSGTTAPVGEALERTTPLLGMSLGTLLCLLLFLGAVGKSAQVPLHVWLPDAMEGPTPVSALIHAATMVTAGVYLLARMSFLFATSPMALGIVAIVGAVTAVFAGLIAVTQRDIKRVLAYSTVSQLGFMFMAMGVGSFVAGMFHLLTHAFFKALLFLGAGSVMHGMHDETDVMKMGALRAAMPATAITFLIATLAIAGIPPFAGFFSKDEILWGVKTAFNTAIPWVPTVVLVLGLVGTVLTAFYMMRIVALTFYGTKRWEGDIHPHESPAVMTVPLRVLAFFSVIAGFIGIPAALGAMFGGLPNVIEEFLHPAIASSGHYPAGEGHASHTAELGSMGISVVLATIGLATGILFYSRRPDIPKKLAERFRAGYRVLFRKFYVDEIYGAVLIRPFLGLARAFGWTDLKVVDGAVNGTGRTVRFGAFLLSRIQTGNLQFYGAVMLVGVIVLIVYVYRNFM